MYWDSHAFSTGYAFRKPLHSSGNSSTRGGRELILDITMVTLTVDWFQQKHISAIDFSERSLHSKLFWGEAFDLLQRKPRIHPKVMDATKKPLRIPPEFGTYAEEHGIFDLYKVSMFVWHPISCNLYVTGSPYGIPVAGTSNSYRYIHIRRSYSSNAAACSSPPLQKIIVVGLLV